MLPYGQSIRSTATASHLIEFAQRVFAQKAASRLTVFQIYKKSLNTCFLNVLMFIKSIRNWLLDKFSPVGQSQLNPLVQLNSSRSFSLAQPFLSNKQLKSEFLPVVQSQLNIPVLFSSSRSFSLAQPFLSNRELKSESSLHPFLPQWLLDQYHWMCLEKKV